VESHKGMRLHDRVVNSAPGMEENDDPRYRLREATQPTRHDNNERRVHTTFGISQHDPATTEHLRTNYP
jgi:hypothetical protein